MTFNQIVRDAFEQADNRNLLILSIQETYIVKPRKQIVRVKFEDSCGNLITRIMEVTE